MEATFRQTFPHLYGGHPTLLGLFFRYFLALNQHKQKPHGLYLFAFIPYLCFASFPCFSTFTHSWNQQPAVDHHPTLTGPVGAAAAGLGPLEVLPEWSEVSRKPSGRFLLVGQPVPGAHSYLIVAYIFNFPKLAFMSSTGIGTGTWELNLFTVFNGADLMYGSR